MSLLGREGVEEGEVSTRLYSNKRTPLPPPHTHTRSCSSAGPKTTRPPSRCSRRPRRTPSERRERGCRENTRFAFCSIDFSFLFTRNDPPTVSSRFLASFWVFYGESQPCLIKGAPPARGSPRLFFIFLSFFRSQHTTSPRERERERETSPTKQHLGCNTFHTFPLQQKKKEERSQAVGVGRAKENTPLSKSHHPRPLRAQQVVERVLHKQGPTRRRLVANPFPGDPRACEDGGG